MLGPVHCGFAGVTGFWKSNLVFCDKRLLLFFGGKYTVRQLILFSTADH